MGNGDFSKKKDESSVRKPIKIQLPGFIVEREIGLGDVVKRVTSSIGIHPCAGCKQRAELMNRWLTFVSRSDE